jgi:hypothetical protein
MRLLELAMSRLAAICRLDHQFSGTAIIKKPDSPGITIYQLRINCVYQLRVNFMSIAPELMQAYINYRQ